MKDEKGFLCQFDGWWKRMGFFYLHPSNKHPHNIHCPYQYPTIYGHIPRINRLTYRRLYANISPPKRQETTQGWTSLIKIPPQKVDDLAIGISQNESKLFTISWPNWWKSEEFKGGSMISKRFKRHFAGIQQTSLQPASFWVRTWQNYTVLRAIQAHTAIRGAKRTGFLFSRNFGQ